MKTFTAALFFLVALVVAGLAASADRAERFAADSVPRTGSLAGR